MSLYIGANNLYDEKKYEEAYEIIIEEINAKIEFNIYTYALYGRICRKLNKQEEFLRIIKPLLLDEEVKEFSIEFFADIIGWCLYDLYIFKYNEKCDYDIIEKSKFIVENCKQKKLAQYNYNPFVLTIFKIVKVLKDRSNVNYKKIIELLELLDPLELPLDNFIITKIPNGKEMELASSREIYYQDLTKAYEKTRQFEKAYALCDKALNENLKWHYENDLWIEVRKYYCLCLANIDFDINIEEYKKIAEKRKFWFMYHNLGNLLIAHSNIDEGFYYLCLALDIYYDPENKYGVMLDIANILLNVYKKENEAKKFYQAALYFKTLNGWSIENSLDFRKKQFNLSDTAKPNLYELKKLALTFAVNIKTFNTGSIKKLNINKGFGFIKLLDESKDIYFRTRSFKNQKQQLKKDIFVKFKVKQHKNREEAIQIEKI